MLRKSDLARLIDTAIAKDYKVHAPQARGDKVYLEEMEDSGSLEIDHVITVNGVKDIMLPRFEGLAGLRLDDTGVEPLYGIPEKRVVIGTRPCDAASLRILDAILLDPVRDTRYASRREETVVVTVACSRADSACFCSSVGCGPHDETGSDVILLPSGGSYIVKALTGKGRSLLEDLGGQGDQGGQADRPPRLVRQLNIGGLKEWLDGNFESDKWREVSLNCISCGICYYLCPTCHCFDIVDEAGVSRGERYRIWDCCSFSHFTEMAGYQPRVGRHARYRQRIMHKFKYTVDNANLVACVGDGRCIRHCPAGVDMGEILEKLVESRPKGGGNAVAGEGGHPPGEE